jgi:hypothetical protein
MGVGLRVFYLVTNNIGDSVLEGILKTTVVPRVIHFTRLVWKAPLKSLVKSLTLKTVHVQNVMDIVTSTLIIFGKLAATPSPKDFPWCLT